MRSATSTASRRPLKEIIAARIWAGLHYRTADVQARNLGKKVAHYMAKHYFHPLDDDDDDDDDDDEHDDHHGTTTTAVAMTTTTGVAIEQRGPRCA